MTQHYADFDIQVKSILNQSEEELFDDAEEYLTSVLLRTLSVRAPNDYTGAPLDRSLFYSIQRLLPLDY